MTRPVFAGSACVGLIVPENCAISEQQLGGAGLDDWRTAIRNATIGSTHLQSGSIFVASGVKRTETLLGSVVLNFQVVGDCLTTVPVANDHLIERLLQMEELHAAW